MLLTWPSNFGHNSICRLLSFLLSVVLLVIMSTEGRDKVGTCVCVSVYLSVSLFFLSSSYSKMWIVNGFWWNISVSWRIEGWVVLVHVPSIILTQETSLSSLFGVDSVSLTLAASNVIVPQRIEGWVVLVLVQVPSFILGGESVPTQETSLSSLSGSTQYSLSLGSYLQSLGESLTPTTASGSVNMDEVSRGLESTTEHPLHGHLLQMVWLAAVLVILVLACWRNG